ncbi:hypothetical protein KR51_00006830 [Rubidibacter lacunae KORDI 51-2]|uniref:Uncharacterized protein n=1 Tax=Rubidibacter lacunae KORDI 51-2 TaxID=582515 RepID=U5DP38_9CHRO|nr:hypothetical protein KR51_00006830 [Rubidibacter lacunae KORDI 51-2]
MPTPKEKTNANADEGVEIVKNHCQDKRNSFQDCSCSRYLRPYLCPSQQKHARLGVLKRQTFGLPDTGRTINHLHVEAPLLQSRTGLLNLSPVKLSSQRQGLPTLKDICAGGADIGIEDILLNRHSIETFEF